VARIAVRNTIVSKIMDVSDVIAMVVVAAAAGTVVLL